jgi:hypothetical protein
MRADFLTTAAAIAEHRIQDQRVTIQKIAHRVPSKRMPR